MSILVRIIQPDEKNDSREKSSTIKMDNTIMTGLDILLRSAPLNTTFEQVETDNALLRAWSTFVLALSIV